VRRAGSDLASLRTRAEPDGGDWIVTGQKVWTSGAGQADRGILPARSDPASRRNRGITYFLVDKATPGIEVRPLVQINQAAHLNEVFLRDVRGPRHGSSPAAVDGDSPLFARARGGRRHCADLSS
jgi:alkylation response protein AidB-like acyl-CoA dehydrogenase